MQTLKASVLSAAYAACYKNKGRNRVHVYQLDETGAATWRNAMGITNYKSAGESLPPVLTVVPIAQTERKSEH